MVLIKILVQRGNLGKKRMFFFFFNHSSQRTVCFSLYLHSDSGLRGGKKWQPLAKWFTNSSVIRAHFLSSHVRYSKCATTKLTQSSDTGVHVGLPVYIAKEQSLKQRGGLWKHPDKNTAIPFIDSDKRTGRRASPPQPSWNFCWRWRAQAHISTYLINSMWGN